MSGRVAGRACRRYDSVCVWGGSPQATPCWAPCGLSQAWTVPLFSNTPSNATAEVISSSFEANQAVSGGAIYNGGLGDCDPQHDCFRLVRCDPLRGGRGGVGGRGKLNCGALVLDDVKEPHAHTAAMIND